MTGEFLVEPDRVTGRPLAIPGMGVKQGLDTKGESIGHSRTESDKVSAAGHLNLIPARTCTMTGLAFDTLKYTKRLKDAGVAAPQAEIQSEFLAEVLTENLASKEDLAKLDARMDIRFKEVDIRFKEIDTRFKELDTKMDTRFKELDTKMETRFREQDTRMDTRFKEQDTRMDIRFKEIDTRLKEMDAGFKRDNKELELRMVIKLGAMIMAGFGLMITANRLWPTTVQYVPAPHAVQDTRTPSPPVQQTPVTPPRTEDGGVQKPQM
ncbi:MAG: CCDC90 family protein [Magnetococcus sp. DMHC-1]